MVAVEGRLAIQFETGRVRTEVRSPNIDCRRANSSQERPVASIATRATHELPPRSWILMPVLFALSTLATILIIPCVVVVLLLLFGVGVYNSLITLRNRYQNAFSQIDVQLKRRYDLIPNLVETAKGYMRHERETLEAVINARNSALTASQRVAVSPGDATAMGGLNLAESQLSAPSAACSPWPRPIPTSRPTRTCWPSRRN